MKNYGMRFIIIFLFCSGIFGAVLPQSLNIGFKYEPFLYVYSIDDEIKTELSYLGGNIFFEYQLTNRLRAELYTGFNFVDDRYRGIDLGVRIKSFPFDYPFYFSGGLGITFLRNAASSHSYRSYEKEIYFGFIGIGKEIINNFEVQLNYQFPIGNRYIGHAEFLGLNPENKSILRHKLIGLLKFGIGVSLDLLL